jgi:hypothetical protein
MFRSNYTRQYKIVQLIITVNISGLTTSSCRPFEQTCGTNACTLNPRTTKYRIRVKSAGHEINLTISTLQYICTITVDLQSILIWCTHHIHSIDDGETSNSIGRWSQHFQIIAIYIWTIQRLFDQNRMKYINHNIPAKCCFVVFDSINWIVFFK